MSARVNSLRVLGTVPSGSAEADAADCSEAGALRAPNPESIRRFPALPDQPVDVIWLFAACHRRDCNPQGKIEPSLVVSGTPDRARWRFGRQGFSFSDAP